MNLEQASKLIWRELQEALADQLRHACPDNQRLDELMGRLGLAVDAGWLSLEAASRALERITQVASPLDTLLYLVKFLEAPDARAALEEPGALEILLEISSQGEYPAHLLRRTPADLVYLANIQRGAPAATSRGELDELLAELDQRIAMRQSAAEPLQSAIFSELRRLKHRESLRIFLREIDRTSSVRQTAAQLARVAEACVHAACVHGAALLGTPELVDDFCVLGMGKFGGQELNFSSDIDLIFICANPPTPDHKTRLTQLARWVTRALGDITDEGYVFRVDLRLRPEGSKGELVNSVGAMVNYYLNWGSTWERSALLKARPVGGNYRLGDALLEELEPFIFRRYLDFKVLDELRAMKKQIDRNAQAQAIIGLDEPSAGSSDLEEASPLSLNHSNAVYRTTNRANSGAESSAQSPLKARLRKKLGRPAQPPDKGISRPFLPQHAAQSLPNDPQTPFAARHTMPGTLQTGAEGDFWQDLGEDPAQPATPPNRADLAGAPYGWDVKIGLGGIREIEFFVQALQLVHSGTRSALRVRGTLDALDRLLYTGLISHEDHAILADSYDLFRRVEHRIQMERDRQSHRVPADPRGFERLARRMGMNSEQLRERLTHYRRQVASIFERLFRDSAQTSQEPTVRESRPGEVVTIMGVDPENLFKTAVLEALMALGFNRPRQVAGQLQVLRERNDGPFGRRASLRQHQLAHYILEAAASAPNPDQAFSYWARLSAILGDRPDFYSMLFEYPHATRLLIHLFGSSEFLASIVLREPNVIDYLLGADTVAIVRERDEMAQELDRRLLNIKDPAHRLGRVRRFYQEEVLRIALHEVAGACEIEQTVRQLSMLAEVIIDAVLFEVFENLIDNFKYKGCIQGRATERPRLEDLGFVVLAMGKLGGRELSFGSDLDIVFIYDPAFCPQLEPSFYLRLAQRLVRNLSSVSAEGKLYDVDTRLRPSGGQGTLVVSIDGFLDYHKNHADLWERQAMLRARALTGPRTLRQRIMKVRRDIVFRRPVPADLGEQMRRMRDRIIAEFGGAEDTLDIKNDPGGMVDVEFLTQFYQLFLVSERVSQHAISSTPSNSITPDSIPPNVAPGSTGAEVEYGLTSQNIIQALRALHQVDDQDLLESVDFLGLTDDYQMLRRVEARLRMSDLRASTRLPTDSQELSILARQLGYQGANADARLIADLTALNQRILQAFQGARHYANP